MSKKRSDLFKKVFSIVVAGATALLLCFCPIYANNKSKTMIASADTVTYSYEGSNLPFVYTPYVLVNGGATGNLDTSYAVLSFDLSSSGLTINTTGQVVERDIDNIINIFDFSGSDLYSFGDSGSFQEGLFLISTRASYTINLLFYYSKSANFNFNIKGFELYSEVIESSVYNTIEYYDSNDNSLKIRIYSYDTPGFALNRREYFIIQPSDSDTYRSAYNQGYDVGYGDGYSIGEGDGYSRGNNIGYNQGYGAGYNTGINEANVYSFSNLIGSVIDVPVQTFMNLFNFELLGVNLAGFFTGLLTLAFIICIVRLILP